MMYCMPPGISLKGRREAEAQGALSEERRIVLVGMEAGRQWKAAEVVHGRHPQLCLGVQRLHGE